MASVYSTCFIAEQGLNGVVTYTVPPGYIAVVVNIDIYCSVLLPAVVRFQDGITGQTIYFFDFSAVSNEWTQWQGREVFETGGQIQMSSTSNPSDVRVNGYLLTTP
jgi:hypothetical protein